MKRLNIILLILSLAAIMYGCSEDKNDTAADPNVINRGESEYSITAELTADDTTKQSYQFGINLGGVMLENEADYHVKWDFGDTTTGEGLKPVHTYVDAGVYNVTAYISDNKTDTFKTSSVDIVSGTDPDIYNTNIVVYRANDRREFTFVASAVSASGETLKYSWNFNDGSPITLAKKTNSVDHIFAKYGQTYNIILTVDNGKGGEGSKVEVPLPVTTELPDLEWTCASGGPAYDNLGNLIGQYLNCQPKLTYGTISDVVYAWDFYSEIEDTEYNPDNQSMIVVQDGIEIPNTEIDPLKTVRYYALNGNGTSNVNDQVSYIFKEGGRKFIKLEGSSQNYLTTNIKYAAELALPNNAFLETLSCTIDSADNTGLTYTCSVNGYSMPKNETTGMSYIAPLSTYTWSVRDQDGNIIDVVPENLVHSLTCSKEDGTIDTINGGEDFINANYKYCTATVTYKASKYDVEPAYSTIVLDADYYELIEGEETSRIYLQQTHDFRVEAPKIQNITSKQNPNGSNPLEFSFSASFDKTINASDVQYHWSFGDGNNQTTNTATATHTFPNSSGTFNVSVYATSSTFARTETASLTVQMNPAFNGDGTFTATLMNNGSSIMPKHNKFTFASTYYGTVDGVAVDTEYEITISGGGFTKTYQVLPENINGTGFSVESVTPTVANLQDNNILSVPYGYPFTATLKITNTTSGDVFYATTTLPISPLTEVSIAHPSSQNASTQAIWVYELKSSSNVFVADINAFTCTYDAFYNNSNQEFVGKLGLSTNANFTQSEMQSTLSVPCGTYVYAKRFDGGNVKLINIGVGITGPYYGLQLRRYLGIYPTIVSSAN